MGVDPDSVTFIEAANNISKGLGYTTFTDSGDVIPIAHFPPLYPFLLALSDYLAPDSLAGPRWTCVLIFGLNIILTGMLIIGCTQGSLFAVVSGSFLMITSVDMLKIHTNILTESLFILFTLLGLLLLTIYIKSDKLIILLISSIALSLAFLTRYSGFATIVAGALFLLLVGRRSFIKRFLDVAILAVLSSLPLGLWLVLIRLNTNGMANHYLNTGALANRDFVFHPITLGHLRIGMSTVSSWLLPGEIPEMFRNFLFIVIAACVITLMALLFHKNRKLNEDNTRRPFVWTIPILLIIYIITYGLFLVFSISFFDAGTMPDSRIMSPAFIVFMIIAICLIHWLLTSSKNFNYTKVSLIILCIIFSASYFVRGSTWIYRAHERGLCFTSRYWKESETMQMAKSLPETVHIHTNAIEAFKINCRKNVHWLPAVMNEYGD